MRVFDISKEPHFHEYSFGIKDNEKRLWTFSIDLDGKEFIPLAYYKQSVWKTEAEATAEIASFSLENVVFVVLKNADFNEGRGPMLLHKMFASYKDALEYIAKQQGVYGSKQYKNIMYGIDIYGKGYCIESFNGYSISIMNIE